MIGAVNRCVDRIRSSFLSPCGQALQDPGDEEVVDRELHRAKRHPGASGDFPLLERVSGVSEHSQYGDLAASPQNRGDRVVERGEDRLFCHT